MKLIDDWREVLRRAWSSWASLLGSAFAGAGMALPAFVDAIPRWPFLALCLICCVGAVVLRLIPQPKLHEEKSDG